MIKPELQVGIAVQASSNFNTLYGLRQEVTNKNYSFVLVADG